MRKLTEEDRTLVLDYCMKEPEYNIFIIGDIENHGFDKGFQEVFAHELENRIDGILLRYMDNFVVYSHSTEFDAKVVADKIRSYGKDCNINGKAEIVEKLCPYFPELTVNFDYLSRLDSVKDGNHRSFSAVRLIPSNAKDVIELYLQVEEFREGVNGKEEKAIIERRFAMEHGELTYGIIEQGKLLSVATATARNSQSAMIIGVCTLPGERGKGYASAVVSALCEACLNEGAKFLCLFYDNPAAGRIYRRIGFVEMGRYMMLVPR